MSKMLAGAILPVACTWAARQEAAILRRGVALSPEQTSYARMVGVARPEKVRVLAVGCIPPVSRLLRALITRVGIVFPETIGMTLRYGIFVHSAHWGERRLLLHELAHVAQYERFGGFQRFLYRYLQECVTPGYPLGELELEAKRMERLAGSQ